MGRIALSLPCSLFKTFLVPQFIFLIFSFPGVLFAEEKEEAKELSKDEAAVVAAQAEDIKVLKDSPIQDPDKIIKRTKKMNVYRCSDCHYEPEEFNTTKRELEEDHHDGKDVHFEDKDGARWCHACHRLGDYDYLKLQSGKKVTFDQSFHLCGECHSTIFRDWKLNLHGKRIGEWNGERKVYSCTECHDPHKPRLKQIEPFPPPERPRTVGKSYLQLMFDNVIEEEKEEGEQVEAGE